MRRRGVPMRRKSLKGYKVVSAFLGKKWSMIVCPQLGGVRYEVNKWTKPKEGCGPLCVFPTYDMAAMFAGPFGGVIYTCEYEKSRKRGVWVTSSWNHLSRKNLLGNTVLADRVKILERVR